jgi:hypothetical protein
MGSDGEGGGGEGHPLQNLHEEVESYLLESVGEVSSPQWIYASQSTVFNGTVSELDWAFDDIN